MRVLFLAAVFILAGSSCFSQKQFEGTIVYKLHAPDKKDNDAYLTVLFGKDGIKMKFAEKDKSDKEELLIRVDSGKIFTLNTGEKTFTAKKLVQKKKVDLNLSDKKIAGYNTHAVDMSANAIMGMMGSMSMGGSAVFYISDSLLYPVPEKYTNNMELTLVQNGRIILGAELKFGRYRPFGEEDDEPENNQEEMNEKQSITVEAASVKWEAFDGNEFTIPVDFVKRTNNYNDMPLSDSTIMFDTAIQSMDSVAVKAPVKKPATNSKQPAKPKAKTNNTKSGAIRKPE
jgi:hypothetical protein